MNREEEEEWRRRCSTEACRHAFDKVAEVYDALADPTQRQLYNQNGRLGLSENGGGGGMASRRDPGPRFHTLFQQAMNVTFSDGWTVLEILYDIGWLRSYYRQRKEREQNPERKFRFRLFDIEYQFQQKRQNRFFRSDYVSRSSIC